jgi:hypothetical protein
MMSRLKRLEGYARPFNAVSGFSSKQKDLNFWRDRASANSYHGKDTGDGPKTKERGTSDLNHVGGSFMPNIRRSDV